MLNIEICCFGYFANGVASSIDVSDGSGSVKKVCGDVEVLDKLWRNKILCSSAVDKSVDWEAVGNGMELNWGVDSASFG
jgi:hypothetical protein